MRKIALLIVLMTVIALTSYAADIAVSINCSSELVFGINLNDPAASGFKNNNTAEVDFTIVSGSAEKGKPEDGAVYGWIKLSGYEMKVDNMGAPSTGDNGDVEAKIMFPMGWVKISSTNADLNYINVVQNDGGKKDTDDKGINDSLAKSGGLVLGLNFAPVTIEIGFFSENDWTQNAAATSDVWGWSDADNDPTTAPVWALLTAGAAAGDDLNDEHAYGVNLKATVDIAPIKIEGGAEMGLGHSDETMAAGAKVSANIAPLTVYAGLDVKMGEAAPNETQMEFGFGASIAIAGITVTADASYNDLMDDFDVRAKVDAGGLVAGLGLALTVELFNLAGTDGDNDPNDMEMAIIIDASYNAGMAKPYASFRYGTFDASDNAYTYRAEGDETVKLTLGVELYVIPNVTFNLKYESGDLTEDTVVAAAADAGIITFSTKIAL